jgi:hypothetical protein
MSESIGKSFDKNPDKNSTPIKHRAEWRYLENGKYNNKPIDKDYFRKYMAVRAPCPNCPKMVLRGDLSKHKKRSICINS